MQEKKKTEGGEHSRFNVTAAGKTYELGIDDLLLMAKCVLKKGVPEKEQEVGDDEFEKFVERYPDVRDFPEEVAEMVSNGAKPLDAYRDYEIAQLRAKVAALEHNETTAKKAIGSAKGDASDDELREIEAIFDAIFRR